MGLIRRIGSKLTGRAEIDALAAELRKAAKRAADADARAEGMQAKLAATQADMKRELETMRLRQEEVAKTLKAVGRNVRERLWQYHLQLGRLARAVDAADGAGETPGLGAREIPLELEKAVAPPWDAVGDVEHPDPEHREWLVHDACPVCLHPEFTVVNPWNKLLLLTKAPDAESIRYDYAICHACGVLSAMRRPVGSRFRFLLDHFDEVTAKRAGGKITNPMLNPAPLTEDDRAQLERLAAAGVFVSDHLGRKDHIAGLMRDRFENSGHADVIGTLIQPRNARVLEVRSRTGSLLDALRRHWNADVYAMPIWESQQLLVGAVYDIPSSGRIDFDHFTLGFEGPFDLIICQHMFTHVVRPREFFATLRQHLKPGGHVYFHNEPDDIEFLAGQQSMIAMLNPLHMQAFDQRAWVRGLAANGFETLFLRRHDNTHLCLARLVPDLKMTPFEPAAVKARIAAYQRSYDRAILRLDPSVRPRVRDEWDRTVERAVATGVAEFDPEGKLRLVRVGIK
jgi:SAM-dependent methyltransferase